MGERRRRHRRFSPLWPVVGVIVVVVIFGCLSSSWQYSTTTAFLLGGGPSAAKHCRPLSPPFGRFRYRLYRRPSAAAAPGDSAAPPTLMTFVEEEKLLPPPASRTTTTQLGTGMLSNGGAVTENIVVPVPPPMMTPSSPMMRVRIRSIRSRGLAGLVGTTTTTTTTATGMTTGTAAAASDGEVVVTFDDTGNSIDNNNENDQNNNNLIAITGETGTGKSLLFRQTMELLQGGLAPASLLSSSSFMTARDNDDNDESSSSLSSSSSSSSAAFCEVSLDLVAATAVAGSGDARDNHDICQQQQQPPPPQHQPLAPKWWAKTVVDDETGGQQTEGSETTTRTIITLRRTFFLREPRSSAGEGQYGKKKKKSKKTSTSAYLSSECRINGKLVPLETLRTVALPLWTVVDAGRAGTALAQPNARVALLDRLICDNAEPHLLTNVRSARTWYRTCRTTRETIETELSEYDDPVGQNEDLLIHWVDELDAFAKRATQFCRTTTCRHYYNDGDDDQENQNDDHKKVLLSRVEWADDDPAITNRQQQPSKKQKFFVSAMYEALRRLRQDLRALDDRIIAIQGAIDALGRLSAAGSARTALETARRLLVRASSCSSDDNHDENDHNDDDSKLYTESLEHSHELLNRLENDIIDSIRFMEDDPNGLLQLSLVEQSNYGVTIDSVDALLADWGSLARKHNVLPTALPLRHQALRNELDGGMGAAERLPAAVAAEQEALAAFEQACDRLRQARRDVAADIVQRVNQRLPSLGMESSLLRIAVEKVHDCRDRAVFASSSTLGCDAVDLLLERKESSSSLPGRPEPHHKRDGRQRRRGLLIGESASAGEKARLLLALECASPGAISVMTNETPTNNNDDGDMTMSTLSTHGGIAAVTIFDEIDAHVGGRATVAVAHMLAEQSAHGQILAITHSPSVAAIADAHWVVRKHEKEKCNSDGNLSSGTLSSSSSSSTTTTTTATTTISVEQVVDEQRKLELARMTSGDVAPEEAIAFAEALMREIVPKRKQQQQQRQQQHKSTIVS